MNYITVYYMYVVTTVLYFKIEERIVNYYYDITIMCSVGQQQYKQSYCMLYHNVQ